MPIEEWLDELMALPVVAMTNVAPDSECLWQLIHDARAAGATGEEVTDAVRAALAAFDEREIAAVQLAIDSALAAANREDIWDVASIVMEGCSDSGFGRFRAARMVEGLDAFEALLRDPDAAAASLFARHFPTRAPGELSYVDRFVLDAGSGLAGVGHDVFQERFEARLQLPAEADPATWGTSVAEPDWPCAYPQAWRHFGSRWR